MSSAARIIIAGTTMRTIIGMWLTISRMCWMPSGRRSGGGILRDGIRGRGARSNEIQDIVVFDILFGLPENPIAYFRRLHHDDWVQLRMYAEAPGYTCSRHVAR